MALVDFELLRQQYKPENIRVLLVGESPPVNGAFFYDACNMTTFTRKAFESALGQEFADNNAFFMWMKQSGFYLEDLSLLPVNRLEGKERIAVLIGESNNFAKRVKSYQPDAVVIIQKSIETIVREAIASIGVVTEIFSLPFPGNGHQKKFKEQLIPIIRESYHATR